MTKEQCIECVWLIKSEYREPICELKNEFCKDIKVCPETGERCKQDALQAKQEAIQNHRKMWNWIADEIEKEKNLFKYNSLSDLKENYFQINNLPEIQMDCFCCEYVDKYKGGWYQSKACVNCPLIWGNEEFVDNNRCFCEGFSFDDDMSIDCEEKRGPYGKCMDAIYEGNYKEAARQARIIANLSEKPEE